MVKVAVREPAAIGVKVTLMAQVAPAASDVPQVLVSVKSLLLVPVMVTPVMLKDVVPLLLKVVVSGALLVPTVWLGKVRLDGQT
jgi:hypothetical protein